MLSGAQIRQFRGELLTWFHMHKRDLPWRRTRDPYAIWISEIMLQQTRVAVVIPYYERFLARFPDFRSLAEAPESELLAHWAGLGYYHRARNLKRAANRMQELGRFPATFAEIRLLPGVGDYTAAAVASISFNLPHAVVDGNVLRVLSRILGDPTDIAGSSARKHFSALMDKLLDREQPGAFNQAVMELGATICLPANPQCLLCPVSDLCRARSSGRQNDLPVKTAAQKSVREERVLFWMERSGNVLAWKRPQASRLMPGFWELPERDQFPELAASRKLGSFRHTITFHNYRFEVVQATPPRNLGPCQWIALDDLALLPASTILKKAKLAVDRYRGGQVAIGKRRKTEPGSERLPANEDLAEVIARQKELERSRAFE